MFSFIIQKIRSALDLSIRISVSTLVEVALWCIFFGSFIDPYNMNSKQRLINYLFVQGGGMFLILLSLRYFTYLKSFIRISPGYWLLYPMLIICAWGTIFGRLMGPSSFKAWIFDSLLTYAGASLILLTPFEEVRQRLLIVFRRQFLCAIVFGMYSLFVSRADMQDILKSRSAWAVSSEKSALILLLSLVPFFLGFVVKQGNRNIFLAALPAYMLTIALGLRGMSRAVLITNFLIIPLAVLAVNWKHRGIRQPSFLLKIAIWAVIIWGFGFWVEPDLISKLDLDKAWEKTLWRLTGYTEWAGTSKMKSGLIDRTSNEVENSRGAEGRDFIGSIHWGNYVTGCGFGVRWYSTYWRRTWDVVHSGPLHLIYRGGIPLLVTYFLFFLVAWRTSWRNSRNDPVAMGCFVYLTAWMARFFSYGAHQSSHYTYVYWIVVGLAFTTNIKRKPDVPLANNSKLSSHPLT